MRYARRLKIWTAVTILLLSLNQTAIRVHAQPLDLDGVTGGQLAPWALVPASPKGGFGKPVVAEHYLDAGPIVGDVHTATVSIGFDGRWEMSYAHYFIDGPTPVVSSDLDTASVKYNAVPAHGSCPAISVGVTERYSAVRDLSAPDFYVVATRIFPFAGGKAILGSLGMRSTEAAIYGIAGKADRRETLPFGTLGFIFNSHIAVGTEVMDQPGTDTEQSWWIRIIPGRTDELQILVALAHVQDSLKAGEQFTSNVSYRF